MSQARPHLQSTSRRITWPGLFPESRYVTLGESAVAKSFPSGDQARAIITLPKVATAMERTNVQLFLGLFHCQLITFPPTLTARAFPSGDHAPCVSSSAS